MGVPGEVWTTFVRVSVTAKGRKYERLRSDSMFAEKLVLVQHFLKDSDKALLASKSEESTIALTSD